MGFGMPDKINELTPFCMHEGRLVSYTTNPSTTIFGIYHERNDSRGMYWMEFDPSLIQEPSGQVIVIRNSPTIVTNFSGTMRPYSNHISIDHLANEMNKNNMDKDKKEKSI